MNEQGRAQSWGCTVPQTRIPAQPPATPAPSPLGKLPPSPKNVILIHFPTRAQQHLGFPAVLLPLPLKEVRGEARIRARESQGSGSSPKHESPAGKQMVRKNDWRRRRLITAAIENQIEGIRAWHGG